MRRPPLVSPNPIAELPREQLPGASRRGRWLVLLGFVALALVETAVAYRFLHAPPVGDDNDELAFVRGAGSWTRLLGGDCYGLFRPVKNLLFAAVARTASSNTAVWHACSLVLYVLCTGLVYVWLARRLEHRGWALAGAAVWALAPTQVSAVAWFSCCNILVGAILALCSSLLYDRYHARAAAWRPAARIATVIGVAALYALAALSYESYLVLPALLLLDDAARSRLRGRAALLRAPIGAMALAAVLCLAARHFDQAGYAVRNISFGPMGRGQVALASAWFTLDHLSVYVWPFGRQAVTSTFVWGVTTSPAHLVLAWVIVAALAAAAWMARRAATLFSLGVGWFFVAFAPTSNLLGLRNGPYGDYYLVLPSIGLALALVAVARRVAEACAADGGEAPCPPVLGAPDSDAPASEREVRRPTNPQLADGSRRDTASSSVIGAPLERAKRRQEVDAGPAPWQRRGFRAAVPAALVLFVLWRGAAAAACFPWAAAWNSDETLCRANLRSRPYAFTARLGLARMCLLAGRLDEAERLAITAHDQAPWQEQSYYVLGDVYTRRGDIKQAWAAYAAAERIYPDGAYPYFALGYLQEVYLHDLPGAARSYEAVLARRWNQSSAGAAQNLCRVLIKSGRIDDAARVIEAALQREPGSAPLHYSAAVVWKLRGNLARAQEQLDRYNRLIGSPRG